MSTSTSRASARTTRARVAIILRQVNLLQKLEQTMWQAGIYWRVSDMLLIIVLLFGAGFAGG